ncbi:hypothetical protein H8E07_20505 [bacterium]|nr:hypothetical protein [bacterium]
MDGDGQVCVIVVTVAQRHREEALTALALDLELWDSTPDLHSGADADPSLKGLGDLCVLHDDLDRVPIQELRSLDVVRDNVVISLDRGDSRRVDLVALARELDQAVVDEGDAFGSSEEMDEAGYIPAVDGLLVEEDERPRVRVHQRLDLLRVDTSATKAGDAPDLVYRFEGSLGSVCHDEQRRLFYYRAGPGTGTDTVTIVVCNGRSLANNRIRRSRARSQSVTVASWSAALAFRRSWFERSRGDVALCQKRATASWESTLE